MIRTITIPAMIFGSGLPLEIPAGTEDPGITGGGELTAEGEGGTGDSIAAPQLSQNFIPSGRAEPQIVQNFCTIPITHHGD